MDDEKRQIYSKYLQHKDFKESKIALKKLSVAFFAGCLMFLGHNAYATETPVPTLDVLHNSGIKILGLDEVYPASAYTFAEVTPSDPNNLAPNVVKYQGQGSSAAKYYEISLKYSVYGEGSTPKYFKWSKDNKGVCLVETPNASEAILTLMYNAEDKIAPIFQNDGNTLSSVNKIYVAQDIQKQIASSSNSTILNVSSTFAGNTLNVTGANHDYSVVMTENDGKITNVNSSFIGNTVTVDSSRTTPVYGTLVKSLGTIENITSEFIGNSVTSEYVRVNGGLIQAPAAGIIGNVTADAILNKVTTGSVGVEGAIIANSGTVSRINGGMYLNNSVASTSGYIYGGVLYNDGVIDAINDTVFSGNNAKTSGTALGGAIYNIRELGSVTNTIFTDNYAQGSTAHGGAIYTASDMKFNANEGNRTEFSGNYVINNGTKTDEAIYVGDKNATLTFSATDNGSILLKDSINGESGYGVTLTGDITGTISLYNNINNANISASNVNIDMSEGVTRGYNFLSLDSQESAKYSLDIDFSNNSADTFTLGSASRGTIYVDNLNIIGGTPTTSKIIRILTGPDSIKLELAPDLISEHITEISRSTVNDTINSTTAWDKKYYSHTTAHTITEGIKTAISGADRTSADSIEYYYKAENKEVSTDLLGDTFKLMNQKSGDRRFNAVNAEDVYTLTENLGETAKTDGRDSGWQFYVTGKKDGDTLSTIDANGKTMFEINDVDNYTKLRLENLNIRNLAATDGAFITNNSPNGLVYLQGANFNIEGPEGSNGIVNNGTLEISATTANISTGINGTGTLNFRNNGNVYMENGASISQGNININGAKNLYMGTGSIDGNINIVNGRLYVLADKLLSDNITGNSWLYLTGGTLNEALTRATGSTAIAGDVTLNALLSTNNTILGADSTLTANADYIGTALKFQNGISNNNRTINLTGGTLNYNINGTTTNILGNVTFNDGIFVYNNINVAKDKTLTVLDAGAFVSDRTTFTLNDGSVFKLTGGTLANSNNSRVEGTGRIDVDGNVEIYRHIYTDMHILPDATLTTNADKMHHDIVNDSILKLTGTFNGNNLNNIITGDGRTVVDGKIWNNQKQTQNIEILEGSHYITTGANLGNSITNNGTLQVQGGNIDYDILGNGTLWISDGRTNLNTYTENTLNVHQNLYTNADNIGADVLNDNWIYLTGGTLNHNITGTTEPHRGAVVATDGEVIVNSKITADKVEATNNGILTVNADNIDIPNTNEIVLTGGILNFTGGTINNYIRAIYGSGTTNISGKVALGEGYTIKAGLTVADTGEFTADMRYLQNSVTNSGKLYASGTLTKNILGDGTTYIDGALDIASGGQISGKFDLNNGLLTSVCNWANVYNLGTVTNTGDAIFNIYLDSNRHDQFRLNSASDGIFRISGDTLNFLNVPIDGVTDKTFQILLGGSSAQLALTNPDLEFQLVKEHYDDAQHDVYFDDIYHRYIQNGVLNATLRLATTQTTNDSINIHYGDYVWEAEETQRGDLLAAWNKLETPEERFFRFKTADDNYTTLENLGKTSDGTLNVIGVLDEETGNRSTVNMGGFSGFELSSGNTLNITNTEFANATNRVINSTNATIGALDSDGNVQGGLVGVVFRNNSTTYSATNNNKGGAIYADGGTIYQIKDSKFISNSLNVDNADFSNKIAGDGGAFLLNGKLGVKETVVDAVTGESTDVYKGGIINTVFDGNHIEGSQSTGNIFGGALNLYSNKAFISNIIGSTFKNNYIKNSTGELQGGALMLSSGSVIHNIENTLFENNYLFQEEGFSGMTFGGAIRLNQNAQIDRMYNVTFNNNRAGVLGGTIHATGGAIHNEKGLIKEINASTFTNNTATVYGGGIFNCGTINLIEDSLFQGNSANKGGAITTISTLDTINNSQFINNTAENQGGAIYFETNINTISNSKFIGNTVTGPDKEGGAIAPRFYGAKIESIDNTLFENNGLTDGGWGGAIIFGRDMTVGSITNSTFRGNYVTTDKNINSRGGAISTSRLNNNPTMDIISNCIFENNYVKSNGASYVYGGALELARFVKNGIVNTVFRNNYVENTNTLQDCSGGGAIVLSNDLTIKAQGEGGLSEFTGNYVLRGTDVSDKLYEAIYISANNTLTLDANTGGRILFNDYIRGQNNSVKVKLTGDSDGTISLYNKIENAAVSAELVNIDTADGNLFDYNFSSLDSKDSAKYSIDIDFANSKADNFTVGENSTGTVFIDNLNVLTNPDKPTTVQILKTPDSSLQLALNSDNINVVDNVLLTLNNVVYDTDVLHQLEGLTLGTTDTLNDSITLLVDTTYDNLNSIGASEVNNDRQFVFNSENVYNLSTDLDDIAAGTFAIKGLEDSATQSTINANGHSLFNLPNATELQITNTKVTGADTIITVANEGASVNLKNAYIDGNITSNIANNKKFNININGTSNTVITGLIDHADTTLSSGILSFANNTFGHSSDTLTVNNGKVLLKDSTIKNYYINKLTSVSDAGYDIDLDLQSHTADKIVLSDSTSKGVIKISDINYLNTAENGDDFTVQVLNTNNNNNISLALGEELSTTLKIKDISRIENDQVQEITHFDEKFHVNQRNGVLSGDIYLATTATQDDSIRVVIGEDWADTTTIVGSLGDTLKLVNQADLPSRTFAANSATDIYNATDSLGQTSAGTLTINGTSDGEDKSAIHLRIHSGFELGADSTLNINNTIVTGNNGVILAKDAGAVVNLNNASIHGDIRGDEEFHINISGAGDTALTGNIQNGYATLSRGGLTFSENTFAGASTLDVQGGSVYMDDSEIKNYNINNLISSDKSKLSVDVDLENRLADTITVNSGTGVIVLEKFNFIGGLTDIDPNNEYTIQILKTPNDNITLDLSETVKSQIDKEIKLGTDHVIVDVDDVPDDTLWSDKYYITEQEQDIYGRLNLYSKETTNDSLHLYQLRVAAGETKKVIGDTLKLWSQAETANDRTFNFVSAENVYNLSEYLGTTTEGKLTINGIADIDASSNPILSTINMNRKSGFVLENETELTVNNINFDKIGYKDGCLIDIQNPSAVVNLNNVTILGRTSSNSITNAGTVNLTGGQVLLNSGIRGTGNTYVKGADVIFGDNVSITQSLVNVNSGSLTMSDTGVIKGKLTIDEDGTASVRTEGIIGDVENDGNIIFRGGNLTHNVMGTGTTNISGEVLNNAEIGQNVNINDSGKLTSNTSQLGGGINNSGELLLDGELSKVITGSGTTYVNENLKLAEGTALEGRMELNNGNVSTSDNSVVDYNIGSMTGNGSFDIDVNLTDKSSDKFIVGNNSSGIVYIDKINCLNSENIDESLKIQVLDTNGTDAIQLALNSEISDVDYKIGRTSRNEQDSVNAITRYNDLYNTYVRGGDIYGNIVLGTTATTNDSLTVAADYDNPQWDETREKTGLLGDTLALWNQLDETNKNFILDKDTKYTVGENFDVTGLGQTKGDSLTITGVSTDDTTKSTVDLNNKTGFELVDATQLNITDTKLTGNETLITVSNTQAGINLKDSYIEGNIIGDTNYQITIDGANLTTIDGKITNADTTLSDGILHINTDTFKSSDDTLTVSGGRLDLQDGQLDNYEVQKLTSSENGHYSIDINQSANTSDKLTLVDTSSTGTILIDSISYITEFNPAQEFKVQILDSNENAAIQLALSDELKKTTTLESISNVRNDLHSTVNYLDKFHDYIKTFTKTSSVVLATTATTNDSIALEISEVYHPEVETERLDTLKELNQYAPDNNEDKNFNFDTEKDNYTVKEDLGTTVGTLNINGVSNTDGTEHSAIYLDKHTGFELTDNSELNIKDVTINGGESGIILTSSGENSRLAIEDSTIEGDLIGQKHFDITLNGDKQTVLDGIITNAQTTLESGTLKINTDTFADDKNKLIIEDGRLDLQDNSTDTYDINELTSSPSGKYSIDVDLSNNNADKLHISAGSGTILLDNIKYMTSELEPEKEFTIQILDTEGNNNLQLALSDELKQSWIIDTRVAVSNDLHATVDFDDKFHDFIKTGTITSRFDVATTKTTNDSIAIVIDDISWGTETSTERLDTLKELNQYTPDTDDEKNFNFKDSQNVYTVAENLGTTVLTLNINGVSSSETAKSTINLNKHSGFELTNNSVLNINNTKLTGGLSNTLISATGEGANVTIKDSYIDGNLTGNSKVNVKISGSDVTTINGTFTNADTELTSGTLKFNTDTFAANTDKLTVTGGNVSLNNGKTEDYYIDTLNSATSGNYHIDINLADKTADTFNVTNGSGIVTLDTLNIFGTASDVDKEYKIQILYVNSDSLQLALSEEAQSQLDAYEYQIGKNTTIIDDEVKEVTKWTDIYNRYSQEHYTYGKLNLAQTNTVNDSIGIQVTRTEDGDENLVGPLGDTLRLVNNAVNIPTKTFAFNSSLDEYKVSENLGQTNGKVIVNGVNSDGKYSTINFDTHSGFETSAGSVLEINNTTLTNAKSETGSVINAQTKDSTIKLTNVIIANNHSDGLHGAAIYSNSDVDIIADSATSSISGNSTSNDNEAIYLGHDAHLTLSALNKGNIRINDKFNGDSGYKTSITGDETSNIYLYNKIDNSNISMDTTTLHLSDNNHFTSSNFEISSGRLDLVNNNVQNQQAKTFNILGSFNLDVDVDLKNQLMDRLPENTKLLNTSAFVNVDKINLLSDTEADSVAIPFAYNEFKANVKYIGADELSKATQVTTAFSPIYKYSIRYENRDDLGYFVFGKGGGASPSSPEAYNPAILASPVATQAAGQSAMNETFRYVFEHADAFTQLPAIDRLSQIKANQYAISTDFNQNLGSLSPDNNNAVWFRPYSSFESINLSNGPKVSTINYGTLVGYDSDFRHLKNGWSNVGTGYIGYNGSQINYSGVDTTMNGGLIGLTETFYKGNFWTALTATTGASVAESNTMYGKEDLIMLMAGIGSKTGYNFEFKEGKYILQPIMFLSYTFVNTFDYTNAAGVRIDNDPMHTVQINPSVRFISNLKGGWQPYAQVGMVWNLLNETNSTANGIKLPEMHTKPYVEYGVGLQKNIKDRFTAFGQALLRNGARNGIALTFGFRWAIGNEGKPIEHCNNTNVKDTQRSKKVIKTIANKAQK